ncbi:DoxX family protein [Candidatus Woesearchaeota archaeon]|nr:DoxX family protein [Candidatus Woesearchaeota archaeon]
MKYTQLILRIGLGVVFFWFGIDKFINTEFWIGFVPDSIKNILPINLILFMYLQGIIESLIGILILIGFYTKIASFFAALILIGIIFFLGISDITIRDFGLLSIAVSLIFAGAGNLSLDNRRKSK